MSKIDPHRILKEIGWIADEQPMASGGGGVVYRCIREAAVDELTNVPWGTIERGDKALTLLRRLAPGTYRRHLLPFFGAGKVMYSPSLRSKREIEALAKVSHPNVVRLLGADNGDPPQCYVMEYFERGCLNPIEYKGKFEFVLSHAVELIDAIEVLHNAGYLHRDIKPKNIFVNDDGRWILGDLGVAYEFDGERYTEGTEHPFSRDWAPLWDMESSDYDEKWDLYLAVHTIGALLLGGKKLKPHWLRSSRSIVEEFPEQRGIESIQKFLERHIVENKDDYSCSTAAQLRSEIIAVLNAVRGKEQLSYLLFSAVSGDTNNIAEHFQNSPIYLSFACVRVFGRVTLSEHGHRPDTYLQVRLYGAANENVFNAAENAYKSEKIELQDKVNVYDLELVFERPLTPGWYQWGFCCQLFRSVTSVVLYGEAQQYTGTSQ